MTIIFDVLMLKFNSLKLFIMQKNVLYFTHSKKFISYLSTIEFIIQIFNEFLIQF
jgi:hypothetical protein